jgi:hypothetical protein
VPNEFLAVTATGSFAICRVRHVRSYISAYLLLQRFDVDTRGKDPNVDEPSLVGAGTAPRGAFDPDTLWGGIEREDVTGGLSGVRSSQFGSRRDRVQGDHIVGTRVRRGTGRAWDQHGVGRMRMRMRMRWWLFMQTARQDEQ